jgi:hypothetical protein
MSAPTARVGRRHEPDAGLPYVLTLKVGMRVDVHRFRTEAERDDFHARVAEFYDTEDTDTERTPR